LKSVSLQSHSGGNAALERAREELSGRLDDLRGLGLLPGADAGPPRGELELVDLALHLVDRLEVTQRRVIETSIQILSLRELITKLLSRRTPEAVAETVALYLLKAFDHERVLVGLRDGEENPLEGWVAIRDGEETKSRPFRLRGEWSGTLLDVLREGEPIHGRNDVPERRLLEGGEADDVLSPFRDRALGSYLAFPLRGGGMADAPVLGAVVVGRGPRRPEVGEVDESVLESVAEAVGTAVENVLLERDVRREEAFRKDVMASMGAGLLAVDLEGRVLSWNAQVERLTGFSRAELEGRVPVELDVGSGTLTGLLRKTLRARRPLLRVERAVRKADGSAFPAACSTALLRNPAGEIYGAILTLEDLSLIKEMEERIRSLDRLAALGRFTAGIAHEIRNPLTGIGTGAQYLARHLEGNEEHAENLSFILREIARLNRIVEDLFRVTHPTPLRKTLEDPRSLLEHAVRSLGSLPAEQEVEIELHVAAGVPSVPADPDQIQQVLLNLLKNAVEASPEGETVDVHVYASGEEEEPRLAIQIVDKGPGIPPEAMPHLFEPFYTKGKPDGTGLGLYVSHGIVERHGGELHPANHSEGGAIFTIKLPLTSYDMTETP